MRLGTPMWKPNYTAHVSVLIETADGRVMYRNWHGRTIRGIHRAARRKYAAEFPGARVSFGSGYYIAD